MAVTYKAGTKWTHFEYSALPAAAFHSNRCQSVFHSLLDCELLQGRNNLIPLESTLLAIVPDTVGTCDGYPLFPKLSPQLSVLCIPVPLCVPNLPRGEKNWSCGLYHSGSVGLWLPIWLGQWEAPAENSRCQDKDDKGFFPTSLGSVTLAMTTSATGVPLPKLELSLGICTTSPYVAQHPYWLSSSHPILGT